MGETGAADPLRLEQEADSAAVRQDLGRAAALLTEACRLDPTSFPRWMKLVAIRRAGGDQAGAMAALSRALAIEPLDFTALLLRASLLEGAQEREDSVGEAYRRALAQMPPSDVPLPAAMASTVARAKTIVEAYVERQRERLTRAAAAALPGETIDGEAAARIARFGSNILRQTRSYAPLPTLFDYPGLRLLEYMERSTLPYLPMLEAATDTIEREFRAVFSAEARARVPYINYRDDVPLAQWRELNQSERWSAIHLIQSGRVVAENARYCPETMRLFAAADQPAIPGMSPNLMFSLLAPHTHIPPHTGVSNTRVVLHLPLIVPAGCRFRVGGETRTWRRGEAFAFDDTIEHEAWNDSDELRVILIADMWRPELNAQERALATAMMVAAGIGSGEI